MTGREELEAWMKSDRESGALQRRINAGKALCERKLAEETDPGRRAYWKAGVRFCTNDANRTAPKGGGS